MAFSGLFFALVFLGILDAIGMLVAFEVISLNLLPPTTMAIVIHLIIAFFAVVLVTVCLRRKKGSTTYALLAAFICVMTPVLGFLVAAWIVRPLRQPQDEAGVFAKMRFGNPLTESAKQSRPVAQVFQEPIAASLRNENHALLRDAASRIRQIPDRKAIAILQELKDHPDAQTHLFAQAAVAAGQEHRGRKLESLRQTIVQKTGEAESIARHERLATALLQEAELNPEFAGTYISEASESYQRALLIEPSDAACLFGKARCHIRLGELSDADEIYSSLAENNRDIEFAPRLALELMAASGEWTDLAEAALKTELSPSVRQFWRQPASPAA